jgi:glycerophosphoryl diester phosphodiesterase
MTTLPKIFAHRGASAYTTENTMAAFNLAERMGVSAMECDVMLSQEGTAYIMHDDTLDRTTNGSGIVGDSSDYYLDSIQTLHGSIPTLQQLLIEAQKKHWFLNLEIKPCMSAQTVASTDIVRMTTEVVLSVLSKHWHETKQLPLLSSFEYEALVFCHQMAPYYPLGFLMHEWDIQWLEKAKAIEAVSIHCNAKILNQKRINDIKAHDFKLLAYTVNSSQKAHKLFKHGVDGIFSDYPDLL